MQFRQCTQVHPSVHACTHPSRTCWHTQVHHSRARECTCVRCGVHLSALPSVVLEDMCFVCVCALSSWVPCEVCVCVCCVCVSLCVWWEWVAGCALCHSHAVFVCVRVSNVCSVCVCPAVTGYCTGTCTRLCTPCRGKCTAVHVWRSCT